MPREELYFKSFDGTEIFYRAWIPPIPPTGAIIFLHRGHEHSGRLIELVKDIHLEDFAIFAWDARGHGKSSGPRGYAPEFYDLVRDVEAFTRHISASHQIPIEKTAVVAHSVAAVVASLWVHDYAPNIRALVLATPAFRVKLYVPLAIPGLRALLWIYKKLGKTTPYVKSYVKGKLLTHDPEEAKQYDTDPLVSKQIAVNVLLGLHDGATRLLRDAGAIHVPTLLLSARTDWVVKNLPQRRFFQNISSTFKRVEVFKGSYHSLFHEHIRDRPIHAAREFILQTFQRSEVPDLTTADHQGYTQEEYAWLKAGLPPFCVRTWCYYVQRIVMQSIGRLSSGILLGWKTGFDSGQSLDYVYRNVASGRGLIGRLIDRAYLDSVGWRGIRQRKINLEAFLYESVENLQKVNSESEIRVVDVAGGPGRYLIDFMQRHSRLPLKVLIRDWSAPALKEGEQLARELNLENISFQQGDAFSLESLRQIETGASIFIVSGLYELFPDNHLVKRSLQGIAAATSRDGYLIYTNQPWHPQLEMIAEVLANRDGSPWVMRRRTQAEMDQLVAQAGFEKIAMRIDNWGIFTVSLARKRA